MIEFSLDSFFRFIISPVLLICLFTIILITLTSIFVISSCFINSRKQKRKRNKNSDLMVGFFHPYCNAGGGGERVLWVAVNAMLNKYPNCKIYIYTGDVDAKPKEILDKAQNTFNIKVDIEKVEFVYLEFRSLIEASKYPYFTLLLQGFGSMIVALEALWKLVPDIYIDTMGFAFTMPVFKYIGATKTATYTHYPTITEDMIRRVKLRIPAHNNNNIITGNPGFTWMKLIYYQMFSMLYRFTGRCCDIIMVNGSWTEDHMNKLWRMPLKTFRVYPPCEVAELKSLHYSPPDNGCINIVSIGQFRPEKDHPLMLQAMYELRTLLKNNEELWQKLKLVFVGSCRHEEDRERVQNLKDLTKHLSLENNVQFKVNVPYVELLNTYRTGTIGLHAMWNEHFGIGVVECMAAGLIMIAHKSGGPLADIIETSAGSQTGFLAVDPLDYAHAIVEVLALTEDQKKVIQKAARASVDRFSQKGFEKAFLSTIQPLMKNTY